MIFNQMRHSWQKCLEIMLSLPWICDWIGNINLFCLLVRITGAFMTCRSENSRKYLQTICTPILDASLVIFLIHNFFVFLVF